MRALHRWPGLLAALLLVVLSLSGAALSLFPATERLTSPQAAATLSVADLAARIEALHPQVEQIRRSPSGRITAYWFEDGVPQAAIIDPATGQGIAAADPNPFQRGLSGLHRSPFLSDGGHMAMAAGAAAMLVLARFGAGLVARRAGGWRRWFAPLRGPLAGRLHVEIARFAVAGLLLSSTTAPMDDGLDLRSFARQANIASLPQRGQRPERASVTAMDRLKQTPVAELRSLSFPDPGDVADSFTLKTDRGTGYLDQGTGAVLAWSGLNGWQRVSETIYMLRTGQGAATLELVLGLMALGVPAMAGTGFALWLAGRHGWPRIRGNAAAWHARRSCWSAAKAAAPRASPRHRMPRCRRPARRCMPLRCRPSTRRATGRRGAS
jgi:sulfite reductase (NADPH) flavoprotein alpha-component